jgi:hypothetical protein
MQMKSDDFVCPFTFNLMKSNVEKNEYSPSGYKINKILKVFKN